jgi:hypothetical protein
MAKAFSIDNDKFVKHIAEKMRIYNIIPHELELIVKNITFIKT